MKFCWTTVCVKEMAESLRFYQDIVGLPLMRQSKPTPDMELSFLGSGETQVELICDTAVSRIQYGDSISMGFQCESLETIVNMLKERKIPVLTGIIQPNPSIRFFYMLDPNGVKIQFVEQIK